MRVVLDSNVLLVAIGKRSRYRPIWNAFVEGKFEIGLCQEILHEYEEVIGEHGAPGAFEIIDNILSESPDVVFKHIYYKWKVITADPDDNKFFDIAVSCNADYLVTNDAHFNVVKNLEFPKVNVCNIETFLEIVMKMT
jgi:putative PIN family toxin of toxin-antitoxin system